MMDSLYLAWKYVTYNRWRSAILVVCITLIAVLPLALELLLDESERLLVARAENTPLVVGAKGSALDLVMNTLYYGDEVPETIPMQSVDEITDTSLAMPIPMYVRYQARGFPIVGTTLDYFDFREFEINAGRLFGLLGECVIGATVAEHLGLKPGDSLLSSPETVFDIAGVYPLKMKIAGVLKPTHSADDLGVFVDINTAWVIEGLAHGHEDLARARDQSVILDRNETNITANAKLMQYREITEDNVTSFHLHGDAGAFPITGIIVLPNDKKSAAILRGRYLEADSKYQIVRPKEAVDTLFTTIFRIKNVLDAVILIVGITTVLALILVFALSLRLRRREIKTIFKLGCSRATIARLLGAELLVIMLISGIFCTILLLLVARYDQQMVRALIM